MYLITQKFYTPIDRFINKFRRKGFWLYTGIILFSFGYIIYSLSNLPDIPPEKKRKRKMLPKSTRKEIEQEEEIDLGPSEPAVPLEQSHSNDHVINTWPKRKLFEFLFNEKIYPDVEEDLSLVKKQVIEIFEFKKENGTLDEKYISEL
ncbi:hypothetical protein Cantr_07191 [Candida viswanathii]|uniref:Uncharacterized protein n=1 Tax=Candida viswanathii TaxID=5486 RepID=A0A367Y1T4_9ASCO|nr:hypothetical protein Cantr_07191 [Candida viswanathii]